MHITSVSIIIPIYNVGLYVEDCIRSVMRQTYDGPMECIVVDDCGTDDSMVKIEKLILDYTGPITFKVLHHTHNRGLSAARNTGMHASTGDYLFFLDSDDEIAIDCIEKLAEPLMKESYDLVVGDLMIVGSDKQFVSLKLQLPNHCILRGKDILNTYRIKWNMLAQNKLYRNVFLRTQHLSFLEGVVFEDELWSLQIACLADSLYAVRQDTYRYRIRNSGIKGSVKGEERMINLSAIIKEICRFAKDRSLYNSKVYEIANLLFNIVLRFYISDYEKFSYSYRQLRIIMTPSFVSFINIHKCNLKRYIRDMHYFLPLPVATYYIYCIIKRRHS